MCPPVNAAGLHVRKVSVIMASMNVSSFLSAKVGGLLPQTCKNTPDIASTLQFLAQLLAQRCLCSRSSVNLTFLPNICQAMFPPHTHSWQRPLVEGGSTSKYRWRVRLLGPAWWKIIFFSIAFMFSTIYLRLEGKVPPTLLELILDYT